MTVGVEEINDFAENFDLQQNFPNPFNDQTLVQYSIPQSSFVELKVYNLIGEEIAVLVSQNQKTGTYVVDFKGDKLPSGFYIARLNANGINKSIKMKLIK